MNPLVARPITAALTALLLVGPMRGAAQVAPPTAAQASAPPVRPASNALPRLERVECFEAIEGWAVAMGVECAWLVVPQLRAKPDGPTVRLPVARLRAKEPDGSPPLVYLHGGPGGQGIVRSAQVVFSWPIARNRDVVVYDHRGAGISEPELCPEVAREIDRRRESGTSQADQERWDENARRCVAAMRADGVEPSAYTTYNNVLDLIDLRRMFGYERWDLYGISYGGVLAQATMRLDPAGLRAVVLAYSATTGPAMQAESTLSYQRSLEHLFSSCEAQPDCRAAYPSLSDDFFELYEELEKRPVDVSIERTSGPVKIRMDGQRYLSQMRCQLSGMRTVGRIPILVHELHGERRERALEVLAGGCADAGAFNATIQLVICHDIHGDAFRRAVSEVRRQVRAEFRPRVQDNPECELWQDDFADASEHEFVKSEIPTLLLTGEFDERAPTDLSKRIASSLSHAWLYELPGESHGGMVTGCHASILFQFLEDPTREPNTSCIAQMPRVQFETKSLMIPNLTLNIVSTSGETGGFVGVWEAEIPNAPRPVSFGLRTDGTSVTGTLDFQALEVFGGSMRSGTLRFSLKSPDGLRTITFTGELRADEILFTRDIEVPDGTPLGGSWIFGANGVKTFTAVRGG